MCKMSYIKLIKETHFEKLKDRNSLKKKHQLHKCVIYSSVFRSMKIDSRNAKP